MLGERLDVRIARGSHEQASLAKRTRLRSTGPGRPTLEAMSLSQPSRVIVVEPVQASLTAPAPAEAPRNEPPPPRVEPLAAPDREAETASRP
jgi:hypothetical protein